MALSFANLLNASGEGDVPGIVASSLESILNSFDLHPIRTTI